MDFIRKHKFTTGVVAVLLVLVIITILLLRFLIPNYSGNLYGNRLSGIDHYKIEDSKITSLKTEISKLEGVTKVSYNLEGRLINIMITVKDEVEKDTAKGYADQALTYFTDEQKEYYDIELILSSENDNSEVYPLFGYKHKTSSSLVWSNN